LPKAHPPLSLPLAGAYTLLAIYGSLYPFVGWHDSGAPLSAFLSAGWPRYTTGFDIGGNIAAYLPFGFLWATTLQSRLRPVFAVMLTLLMGGSLSLAMEALQHFLPSRVPSNLDLACNTAGTLAGALAGARWGRTMLDGGRLHALRHRLFLSSPMTDTGLLLVCFWLLTQLNPDTLLFGNGGLRELLEIPAPLPYSAAGFARVEAAIVAAHALAFMLIVTLLVRRGRPALVLAVLGGGLLAKSFAFLVMMSGQGGLAWATPGSLAGLAIGITVWLVALPLHARWRKTLAAMALFLATTLVNIAPENPYLANTFQTWNPGQFLNFHGLTRLSSQLWPFLALPWLILMRTDHER
jgi:VanZ family protein